jgi:hypothetical protein
MPARELPHRVAEQAARLTGRLPRAARPGPAGTRVTCGLGELVLGWRGEPGVAAFWREQAADVGAGVVRVFDQVWPVAADGTPDWDLDPRTGYRWPADYCFDVPLVPRDAGGPVEVKYVWELSRLVHLLPVAAHAAAAADEDARRTCERHLRSWLAAHPPRRGVAWRSGIELAIRVLSMVTLLELLDRPRDGDLEAAVGRAVAEHVAWLRRFPSRHSSANNHRVAELTGLLVAAAAYPGLVEPAEADASAAELAATALDQFHEDGVPAEQATAYGLLVLEWLAVALHLAAVRGRPLPAAVRERVGAAAGFLATVVDGAGAHVRIGDDDDSRLLTAARPHADLARAVLGLVAAVPGGTPGRAAPGLTTFAAGGCTVWREAEGDAEVLWVLDHGPLGMGSLAAHAHADTLAVSLHAAGRAVLVDAGTYLYHGAGTWRDALRDTAAHNTLTVGGAGSSTPAGPFNWRRSHRARGRLVTAGGAPGRWCVVAEHDGYLASHGVLHRRTLAGLGGGRFRLTDRLVQPGARQAERLLPVTWSLLVAPGLRVEQTAAGWTVRDGAAPVARIGAPAGWARRTCTGGPPASGGWCSPRFGVLEPATRLVLSGPLGTGEELQVDIAVSAGDGRRSLGLEEEP